MVDADNFPNLFHSNIHHHLPFIPPPLIPFTIFLLGTEDEAIRSDAHRIVLLPIRRPRILAVGKGNPQFSHVLGQLLIRLAHVDVQILELVACVEEVRRHAAIRRSFPEGIADFEMIHEALLGAGPCGCGSDDREIVRIIAAELPNGSQICCFLRNPVGRKEEIGLFFGEILSDQFDEIPNWILVIVNEKQVDGTLQSA